MAGGKRVHSEASTALAPTGTSDLLVRLISAVVMALIAGSALWLGGWFWIGFIVLLAGLVLWEWNALVRSSDASVLGEVVWLFFGAVYVCGAAFMLIHLRAGAQLFQNYNGFSGFGALEVFALYILPVIAVDVGAYFVGRAIGGPKIAPKLSPSKTWAGLAGGAAAASVVALAITFLGVGTPGGPSVGLADVALAIFAGCLIAVIAQAGDFFESWMKRRAGAKDSSNLIPGHGGVFDRVDGFLAVFFVLFMVAIAPGFLR